MVYERSRRGQRGSLGYLAALLLIFVCTHVSAQSSDPAFPTPVTSNEISGTIPARAIGDPRLTTYYFVFNGNRGDVFINIVTTNFKGEIDVFTATGLDPRTKVTIYADNPERETGRVVYQRRSEKLIIRIQGRTPNDDPATYQIKFAGSFAPITGAAAENTNEFPDILGEPKGPVRVNSVGTIIEPEPAKTPESEEAVAEAEAPDEPLEEEAVAEVPDEEPGDPPAETKEQGVQEPVEEAPEKAAAKEPAAVVENPGVPRVIVTDPLEAAAEEPREVTVDLTEKADKDEVSAVVTIERVPESEEEAAEEPSADPVSEDATKAAAPEEKAANPLDSVFLRVELLDGSRIERRMSEVTSVNVVDGMLTIVTIEGRTRRIPILTVRRMAIEP